MSGGTVTPPYSVGWSLGLNGIDYISAMELDALEISDSGANANGVLSARYVAGSGVFGVPPSAIVQLSYGSAIQWQGRIASRDVRPSVRGYSVDIRATDLSSDLDRSVVIGYASGSSVKTDKTVVQELVNTYGTATYITAPDATVTSSGASISGLTISGRTLRQALDDVVAEAVSPDYWAFSSQSASNLTQTSSITFGTGIFVLLGDTGGSYQPSVFRSLDGVSWTGGTATGKSSRVSDAVYGGGRFVGVGGTQADVSSDGTAWTQSTLGTGVTTNVLAVTYGASKYVAVGIGGSAFVSSNASTWSRYALPAGSDMLAITYGDKFVAVGAGGSAYVSADGVTWSKHPMVNALYSGIAYGAAMYVAVAVDGPRLSYSSDGTAWSTATLPITTPTLYGVRFVNDQFVAVGQPGVVLTSDDGVTWIEQPQSVTAPLEDIAYANGTYVAVGGNDLTGVAVLRYAPSNVVPTYFVDQLGRLNWNTTAGTAPYAISDAPNGTTSIAASSIAIDYDETGIVNAVYIASAESDWLYGAWVEDTGSITVHGRREAFVVNENVSDATTATTYGNAYLANRASPIVRGSLEVTNKHGWKAGQTLAITNAALGLTGGSTTTTTTTTTTGTAYATAVAASSPTSYYRLGDASGTVAVATTGTNGVYVGSPTLGVTGALTNDTNTAVTYNGSSQLTTAALFTSATTNWTLEAWVKPTSTSQASLIVHNGINTNGFGFGIGDGIGLGGTGSKLVGLYGGVGWYDTGYTFTDTNWHHVVFTRDTTTTRAYVDGTATLNTSTTGINVPTTRLTIGALSNGSGASYYFYYSGSVDEVATYTTALSASAVLAHYNAGITGTTTTTTTTTTTGGDTYAITQVDTSFITGKGDRTYRISFGGLPKSLVRALAAT